MSSNLNVVIRKPITLFLSHMLSQALDKLNKIGYNEREANETRTDQTRRTKMEKLLKELSPEMLAKLTVKISDLMGPGISETDFVTLNRISSQVFATGCARDGAFCNLYMDIATRDVQK